MIVNNLGNILYSLASANLRIALRPRRRLASVYWLSESLDVWTLDWPGLSVFWSSHARRTESIKSVSETLQYLVWSQQQLIIQSVGAEKYFVGDLILYNRIRYMPIPKQRESMKEVTGLGWHRLPRNPALAFSLLKSKILVYYHHLISNICKYNNIIVSSLTVTV